MRLTLMALMVAAPLSLSGFAPEIKSTTRITVSAAHLPEPLEIVDPAVLSLSQVFAGAFIGEIAATPEVTLPRYTLVFDIQTLNGVKQQAYAVEYCVDQRTGESFIYLPGLGEPSYRRNVSTILRDGHDGYWHHASGAWSAAINPYVQR